MKTSSFVKPMPARVARGRSVQAFTLAEMMVAVLIFVFMVLGIIYVWMFGMRYDELSCSKLGASDMSRIGFDVLAGDIRAAKWWKIGNGMGTNFTVCGNATNQIGNALKLSSSSSTNSTAYIIYYFNTNACQLIPPPPRGGRTRQQTSHPP